MGFRDYFGGIVVFGSLYALAVLAWWGVFGVSLLTGTLIGFLIGGVVGLIFVHHRVTELRKSWQETMGPSSPEIDKALGIGIGLGPPSNFTRVGVVLAVVGLLIWAIIALVR